jgi:SAM-dependent methyltransferase
VLREMRRIVAAQPGVVDVPDIFAIVVGPSSVIVDGDVIFDDDLDVPGVERTIMHAVTELRERWPVVDYVYLTPVARSRTRRVSSMQIDGALPAPDRRRHRPPARLMAHVRVVHADATNMPFPDGRFSAAVSFIMLHHVPTVELQDLLLAEVARVLRPGATFAGVDSLDTPDFRDLHVDDICNPIKADTFEARLTAAGFAQARVNVNPHVIEFQAQR